jgi:pimeloyl-ACP methyl ester carboxylesterase
MTFCHRAAALPYRVAGVGHFLMLEKPEVFDAALSAFLSDLPKNP